MHSTYSDAFGPTSRFAGPSYLGATPALPPAPTGPVLQDVPAWAGEGTTPGKLSRAALYQIAKGVAGSRLASAAQAEDAGMFMQTAVDNKGAYFRAAYHMAVAARILGSRWLAAQADFLVVKGNALLILPGSSLATGDIATIFSGAAQIVRTAAQGAGSLAAGAVADQLDAFAASSAVSARQSDLTARSPGLRNTAVTVVDKIPAAIDTAGDITKVAMIGGGILIGLLILRKVL